jgi:hypothetical protein
VLVEPGQLDASAVEVIQDDFAIGGGRGYMRAELAMRPLYIVDAEPVALAGFGIAALSVVNDGSTQIGLLDDFGVVDTHRLEDLLAGEDGMGALAVDVEGGDVQAGFVAGLLRRAGADAAGR